MILARVCAHTCVPHVTPADFAQVIQNSVRTLCVTAMIVVVIGYSFPLFVRASRRSPPASSFIVVSPVDRCSPTDLVLCARHDVRTSHVFLRPTLLTASQSYYLSTSRELKRLDAVSRSPIFAWFSESLNGLSTIRAFGQQQLFVSNNERRVDRNQICYLPSISVNRWLAVRE